MLTKNTTIDKIEVVGSYRHVQVRTATVITENDTELSRSYHRHIIAPGQDYSEEDATVQDVCSAVHTPEIIEAYQNSQNQAFESDEADETNELPS